MLPFACSGMLFKDASSGALRLRRRTKGGYCGVLPTSVYRFGAVGLWAMRCCGVSGVGVAVDAMAVERAEHERVQVQVQVGFVVEVPPTEPVVCLQQGLQHRCWTKSGNTRPPKQPLQEEAILYPSIKDPGTSVPASFYAASARTVPKNSKTRTAHGRPGFGYKNRKKTQRLENCGARRAAFKPY